MYDWYKLRVVNLNLLALHLNLYFIYVRKTVESKHTCTHIYLIITTIYSSRKLILPEFDTINPLIS